jgi:molybdopterin/thiamine biosynthesis adenylyltransferase
METLNVMRHESIFNPAHYPYPFHVIGAGATGSRVFAALVELGITNISVYDDDVVEDHNLANQIYTVHDINNPKVDGCKNFALNKLGVVPEDMGFYNCKVTERFIKDGGVKGGVVFILTDTMASRRTIFDTLTTRCEVYSGDSMIGGAQLARAPMIIIETRMGSTHGSVFTVNPFDENACIAWRQTLIDDTDVDNMELSPCGTALSVGTTAALIANYAVWQMMQFFVDPIGMQPQVDFFFKPTLTITSPAIAA